MENIKRKNNFLEKCKKLYGDKYDYSKVHYIDCKTNIIIICKIHGEFIKKADKFINSKQDCEKCHVNKQKSNTKEFVTKCKKLYGDKYDYSKVHYITNYINVTIICKIHGDFLKKPMKHLAGQGCVKCSANYSKISINWLNMISNKNLSIQHALNKGELKIGNISVDGYCEETNTVYEFHGDFWHGNPKVYNPNDINPRNNKSFGYLFKKTLHKELLLRNLGYNYICMWENDYNKLIKLT